MDRFFREGTKIHKVWLVIRDKQWHCRECEYAHTGIMQIAGGSGIQGLERGSKSRPGLVIESANHLCTKCERTSRHDRWTGEQQKPRLISSMPARFAKRAVDVLGSRDVVDNTERPANQLTVDHKLPMLRWTSEVSKEQSNYASMTDDDIREKFQLLKKSNGSISHNLLKSRSCEQCFKKGKRGTPFGITFFYKGGANWEPEDKKDPRGCIGCGWYDLEEWRKHLNRVINSKNAKRRVV